MVASASSRFPWRGFILHFAMDGIVMQGKFTLYNYYVCKAQSSCLLMLTYVLHFTQFMHFYLLFWFLLSDMIFNWRWGLTYCTHLKPCLHWAKCHSTQGCQVFLFAAFLTVNYNFSFTFLQGLFSPTCFSYASQYVSRYESQGEGMCIQTCECIYLFFFDVEVILVSGKQM